VPEPVEKKELSPEFLSFLVNIETNEKKIDELDLETPKIHINQIFSSAASFYEKIRNTIGYQEESLLRRMAIERIFRRRSLFQIQRNSHSIAMGIIWELIQAGYLKNDSVPEKKIEEIILIIDKYLELEAHLPNFWKSPLLGVAAVEMEAILDNTRTREIIFETVFKTICRHSWIANMEEIEREKEKDKLFIVLARQVFKKDIASMYYFLIKRHFSDWFDKKITPHHYSELLKYQKRIEFQLSAENSNAYIKLIKNYLPMFIVLQDIAKDTSGQIHDLLESPQKLTIRINKITKHYFEDIIAKLNRSIVKAVLFILITKVILGLLVEIPYDLYFFDQIHYQSLLINLLFPPFLMFLSVSLISVPGEENSKQILEMMKKVAYGEKTKDYELIDSYPTPRTVSINAVLNLFYFTSFAATTYLLIWLLKFLEFNLASGVLFFSFLSAVSFFAFRIRKSTSELTVVREKENPLATILDFLLMPFLKIGYWLSKKFEKANIFIFIFDFILEAPFKLILESIEHWFAFLREKKDELTDL
jgi:hypothetical protein